MYECEIYNIKSTVSWIEVLDFVPVAGMFWDNRDNYGGNIFEIISVTYRTNCQTFLVKIESNK
jgi:hypothetical protein